MGDISIVVPHGMFGGGNDDSPLEQALRRIAVAASAGRRGLWPDKYGIEIENDVFAMHPFCWCERPDCPWCGGCTCPPGDWREPPSCDYCLGRGIFATGAPGRGAPNFWHKPSGLKVWWYKYIGRGMETVGEANLDAVLAECLASLAQGPASEVR